MTDKELKAKILAEIERLLSIKETTSHCDELSFNSGRWKALNALKGFIDSLPEEHPYKTGDKVWYLNELYDLEDDGKHYILTSVRNNSVVHLDYGDEDFKLRPYEERVSEDLEEVSKQYALNNTPYEDCADEMQEAFKAGAKWQKEQTISKAVEWLQRNIDSSMWLANFRKHLEE